MEIYSIVFKLVFDNLGFDFKFWVIFGLLG